MAAMKRMLEMYGEPQTRSWLEQHGPKVLLITGSREATPEMLEYARRLVQRAKERDFIIICGDAEGVDAAVIEEADRLGVPCEVHGAYGKLKHRSQSGLAMQNGHPGWTYPMRDELMARNCDICVAVWNGVSRGTKLTADLARQFGKEVHVKTFAAQPQVIGDFHQSGYEWLSNFYPAPISFKTTDGKDVMAASVEHAFQAHKTLDPEWQQRILTATSPAKAKRLGRQAPLRADWNQAVLQAMEQYLRQKFAPGSDLAARLTATGDAILEEGNDWGDAF